ncbi:MAG: hypothetical protein ACI4WR_08235 [Bulleidia sp.]
MNRKRKYYFGKRKPVQKPAEELSEEERRKLLKESPLWKKPLKPEIHKEPGRK